METGLSVIITKGKVEVALRKAEISIQQLIDEEKNLEYNEDNLQKIADYINKTKKAINIVEEEHKRLKAPALEKCRIYDESRRNMIAEINNPVARATKKYNDLCRIIEQNAQAAKQELERKNNILQGIDNNIIALSTKIADAKTNEELINIERLLNLETARTDRYQEFMEIFKVRAESIRRLLKERKIVVDELSKNSLIELETAKNSNEAILDQVLDERQVLEAQLFENGVRIQEKASEHSQYKPEYETIVPQAISPKRSTWEYLILDLDLFAKKRPDLVKTEPDHAKIKAEIANKKAARIIKEETKDGLKIYLKKVY